MDSQYSFQITSFYRTYNEVIKPLIAEIEIRYEKFPSPVFNEIRAFEVQDKEKSLKEYEFVYNKFSELETFLNDNEQHICWARAKYYSSKISKLVGWLLAAIISGIISSIYIPWDRIFAFFY